jgi:K+-sensing histidine kinase KdpD
MGLIITGDHQLVYSALSNVIQNAIKFTPKDHKIQIRGKRIQKRIVIEVEDECGGLRTKNAKDLFKSYEKINENKSGMGLGLAITQKAVTLNRGTIEARDLPGKGCIFSITFPEKQT